MYLLFYHAKYNYKETISFKRVGPHKDFKDFIVDIVIALCCIAQNDWRYKQES